MSLELRKTLIDAPLGTKTSYPTSYDKNQLFPVKRQAQRQAMNFPLINFEGADIWNAYEIFFLNLKGKPVRTAATFEIPANSQFLPESKSVKLYLNSFNHERFLDVSDVAQRIEKDLSEICQAKVGVNLSPYSLSVIHNELSQYHLLDDLDVDINIYHRDPGLLEYNKNEYAHEKLVTHLFKSHCLCTGQPDMGSIFIEYKGHKIKEESLLKYLISYRDHVGFSENCIEQIFVDISSLINPEYLVVFGRFTRRGGIDINPYRSTHNIACANIRLIYQ